MSTVRAIAIAGWVVALIYTFDNGAYITAAVVSGVIALLFFTPEERRL